jgi:cytoskeletal protein CcmA (bactofilin family)
MLLTRKDSSASDSETDTGTPAAAGLFKPTATSASPARPVTSAPPGTAASSTAASGDAAHSQKLIVGQGISLSGEITACDRLVVEGTVKVVLNKTRAIEITETGAFTDGKAEVEEAEISGVYEGELTVRGRLLIRATGKVDGTIRYGELEVERGGKLGGSLALLDPKT